MLPQAVLHKRNGNRPAPGPPALSPGDVLRMIHSDAGPSIRPSYDLLRFAQAVQREKDSALIEQVARGVDAARSSLADVVARTRESLQRGECADVRATLHAIEAQAEIALRIVSGLVAAARPRATERRRINVNQLTLEALAAIAPRLQPGIALSTRIASALPPIAGDEHLLAEALVAFVSFIERALVTARRTGTIRLEVWSRAGRVGGAPPVLIRVSDHGPGTADWAPPGPPAPVAALLDLEAAGPDLSRAVRIIADHGGTVSVEDRAPEGICFTLELPTE